MTGSYETFTYIGMANGYDIQNNQQLLAKKRFFNTVISEY